MIKQDSILCWDVRKNTRITLGFEVWAAWQMTVSFTELGNAKKDIHIGKVHDVPNIQDSHMYDSGVQGGDRYSR